MAYNIIFAKIVMAASMWASPIIKKKPFLNAAGSKRFNFKINGINNVNGVLIWIEWGLPPFEFLIKLIIQMSGTNGGFSEVHTTTKPTMFCQGQNKVPKIEWLTILEMEQSNSAISGPQEPKKHLKYGGWQSMHQGFLGFLIWELILS